MWTIWHVLEIKHRFSARTVYTFNHWAISSVPYFIILVLDHSVETTFILTLVHFIRHLQYLLYSRHCFINLFYMVLWQPWEISGHITLKQENVSNLTAFMQLINNKNKDQIQIICLTGFVLAAGFAHYLKLFYSIFMPWIV